MANEKTKCTSEDWKHNFLAVANDSKLTVLCVCTFCGEARYYPIEETNIKQ